MSVLWFGRDSIIQIYTSNEAVGKILADAWPILIIFTFFDTTQALGMGLIKATGK